MLDDPTPMRVGRYHSLVVRSEDNASARFTVTARGPEGEVMALRYNDRPWAGVQFHPESILTPASRICPAHPGAPAPRARLRPSPPAPPMCAKCVASSRPKFTLESTIPRGYNVSLRLLVYRYTRTRG